MRLLAPCLLVLCAAMLGTGNALADAPSGKRPIYEGYRITVDNGSGQKQEIVVTPEEQARMREAFFNGSNYEPRQQNAAADMTLDNAGPAGARRQNNVGADAPDSAPQSNSSLQLPDGRRLPFAMSGKSIESSGNVKDAGNRKMVDDAVDPHSALRRFSTREQNLSERRYEKGNWAAKQDTSDNFTKTIDYDQWASRFDAWGGRESSSIEMKDSLNAKRRDMPVLEQKKYDRTISPWSQGFAEFKNQNSRYSQDLDSRYLAQDSMSFKDRMMMQNKSAQTVSMQDINRIAFRRNHPMTPGLPITSPGGQMQNDHFSANK